MEMQGTVPPCDGVMGLSAAVPTTRSYPCVCVCGGGDGGMGATRVAVKESASVDLF